MDLARRGASRAISECNRLELIKYCSPSRAIRDFSLLFRKQNKHESARMMLDLSGRPRPAAVKELRLIV